MASKSVRRPDAVHGNPAGSGYVAGADCIVPITSPIGTSPDRALLRACATYWEANSQLNGLLVGNKDPADAIGLGLHRKWTQALSRVLSLPADSAEGERAKSAVLRSAVEVVLGQRAEEDLDSDGLARMLPRGLFS